MNSSNVYDVTIQQIETCVLAAATGSFTSVANSLYMTQSAVSKQIKTVEDRIGIPLFIRERGTSLTLTPAGEMLIGQWQELVKNYNMSLINAEQEQQQNSNNISICAPPSFNADLFLIPAIRAFTEIHPNAQIHIQLLSPGRAKQRLQKGASDIVLNISYRRDLFATEDFICRDIANCNWYIGMRDTNLLSARKRMEWQNLRNQRFIIVNDYIFIKLLNEYCQNAGFEPKIGYASPTFSGFADNTLDDKSVFLCDPFLNDYNKEGYSYFEMDNSPAGYMIVTKTSETKPLVNEFVKFFVNYAKENNLIPNGVLV